MIDQLLDRLEGVRPRGRGYTALCPAHSDRTPSLTINPGKKGWLIYCWSGCRTERVMDAVNVPMATLFYQRTDTDRTSLGLPAATGLRRLIQKVRGTPIRLPLLRFDDVAWYTLPRDERGFALASIEWNEEISLPYGDAMHYWTILRDGWLFTWIGPAWHATGTMDWRETTEWMAEAMSQTYRKDQR
jgi:hypothetical protein